MKRYHPTRNPLFRKLLTGFIGWIRPEKLHTKTGCKLWVPKKDRSIYVVDLFLTGYYERAESLRVIELLSTGDVVVDVGANIGYYTCLMSKSVGAEGVVFAFEPVSDNREVLEENIALNGLNNVSVYSCALAEVKEKSKIYLNNDNLGAHSLVGGENAQHSIEIDVVPFDEVVPYRQIALVKIDVEGYELSVLRGMEEHARKGMIKHILIEYTPSKIAQNGQSPAEFFSIIKRHGFNGEVISNTVDIPDMLLNDVQSNLKDYIVNKNASFNVLLSKDSM